MEGGRLGAAFSPRESAMGEAGGGAEYSSYCRQSMHKPQLKDVIAEYNGCLQHDTTV